MSDEINEIVEIAESDRVKLEMVTITKEEYNQLLEDSKWLGALESAGVDNWEGYDFARELLEEGEEE